jgi:hypothetical protein
MTALGYLPLVKKHMVCVGVPHKTKAHAIAKPAQTLVIIMQKQ